MRGTAFLVGGGKLLTARHVVDEYYNGHKPIVANILGVEYTFTPQKVGSGSVAIDVVVLSCTNPIFASTPLAQEMYLKLMPVPFKQCEDRTLSVIGFPSEMAGGSCQIETVVRPHSPISKATSKYDVVTVREGQFELRSYGGFSGSPVLTKAGYVVGVVSTETYGKLTYCSVERMEGVLKKLGVTDIENRWEVFEDSNLSLSHCEKEVAIAIKKAANRYQEELHTVNTQLEEKIELFTSFSKRTNTEKRLKLIKETAEEDIEDAINAGLVPNPLPSHVATTYTQAGYDELPGFIDSWQSVVKPKSFVSRELKRLGKTAMLLTERLGKLRKQLMCLHGRAGIGKTHISCHVAKKLAEEKRNNVYLLFGSQFEVTDDAWEKMLSLLHLEEADIDRMENRAQEQGHYAIFIIDALNEGAGDLYWKQQLNLLAGKMKDYPHLKLIFTIRDPFMEEITRDIDPKEMESIELTGFTKYSAPKAIEKYFEKFGIDTKYKETYKRQFKHPLFLIVFCNAYWLLTREKRDHLNLRLLYRTYLTSRNAEVSKFAEEDEKRNVTLACMKLLAWYSVEQCNSGLIPRDRARRIADKICPMRTWRNNLLHALLYENLLMETMSDQKEGDLVMFEFENIADVMKAESLLMSGLTERQIIALLLRTEAELTKRGLGKAKFHNMVRALIAEWDRDTDVTAIEEFTSGAFSYELVKSQEEYLNERNYEAIRQWLRENREKYDPRNLLHHLDDKNTTLFDTLHPYLRSLRMSERDGIWTIQVNNFLEGNGTWHYLERLSHNKEQRTRFLIVITWMLTTSDPDGRMFLIRLLYRVLMEEPESILGMMDKFKGCDDHYLLQGLYCAIYGVTLRTRDGKLLAGIAEQVFRRHYEHDEDVPVDINLRQWTLKILERASSIEVSANYFHRISLPFKSQDPRKRMLQKDFDDNYFGKEKGAMLLYYSLSEGSDFHRYTIGSNSFAESSEFFYEDDEGEKKPLLLHDIPKMMAPIIKSDYKYNAELGRYDGSRFSSERHHNKKERIGKKYQWLALDATYARLTDNYWVKDQRIGTWGAEADDADLTRRVWPWMTRRYDRFDPTLPSNEEIEHYAKEWHLMAENDDEPQDTIDDYKDWMVAESCHPLVRMQWIDSKGQVWVRIYGFETEKHLFGAEKRRTMLYYNSSFVKKADTNKMTGWAREKTFNGRWMEERTDCIEFLWNEMPWSDSYKRLKRDGWTEGDETNPYPCKVLVAYDEQLQEENYGFLQDEENYSYSASMPCAEMMKAMRLYTAERGVVRCVADDTVAAINMSIVNRETGLVVRKDILCSFLKKKQYCLYTFILGSKEVGPEREGMKLYDMQDLSGCMMMNEKGEWTEVQKLRLVEK